MKKIDPVNSFEENDRWFPVIEKDGCMRCSCGRELLRIDEDTYQCSYGYPTFRLSDGDVLIDKFGNIMLRKGKHGEEA